MIDIGKFIFDSDVILANMDEPVDPGVVIECMVAKEMGKPVVQYRTDSRGPYGGLGDFNKGMHQFPLFLADSWIYVPTLQFGGDKDKDVFYNTCAGEIHDAI